MNEEEIVRIFLEKGYQLSKNALPLVSTDPHRIIFELGKLKPRPFVVTAQHVNKILREKEKPKLRIEKIKEYKPLKKPITIEDYTQTLHSRYEKIKLILTKRMAPDKLISINKINPKTSVFSIIGVVREKNRNNILVEDPTGEIYVFFDDSLKEKLEEIVLDDVVGLVIKRIKDKYHAKTVVFPDIPSSREISKTENDTVLAVVSNPSGLDDIKYKNLISTLSSTENLSSVVFFNDIMNENVTHDFSGFNPIVPESDPSLFQIENIKILILPRKFFENLTFDPRIADPLTQILKKRHLFLPSQKTHIGHEDFLLTEIPDIVISNLDETINKNYKGTTILSNSNPNKTFLINLKTREVTEKTI